MLAGSALIAGQGQYAQNVNQLLTQQWQTAAQIQNARLMALQQAAMENARQQNQQAFQMQMMPQQAAIESQQQAFQSNLGMQSDAARQAMQAYYGGQQSQQDFQEQQMLSAQNAQQQADNQAAHIQLQQQGQLANQQQMAQFQDDQGYIQQFQQDPLVTMRQNRQQAQQSGYSYSPEQEQQMAQAQKDLSAMQDAVSSKRNFATDFLPDIKQAMGVLNRVSANPAVPPPQKPSQQFAQNTAWFQPNATDPSQAIADTYTQGAIPVQKDQKSGVWKPVVKPGEIASEPVVGEDGRLVTPKVAHEIVKTQKDQAKNNMMGYEWASQQVDKELNTPGGMMASVNDPGLRQRRIQEMMGLFNQMNPGLAKPVHEDPNSNAAVTEPPPAGIPGPQISGQNPQGQPPPQQGVPAQNANGQQQQPQQMSREQADTVMQRLKQTPRDRWTPHDVLLLQSAYEALGIAVQPQQPTQQNGHSHGTVAPFLGRHVPAL